MRFSALQYNFSVPVPSHNVGELFAVLCHSIHLQAEIAIRSLDTAQFDQSAFQSHLIIAAASRELIWSVKHSNPYFCIAFGFRAVNFAPV